MTSLQVQFLLNTFENGGKEIAIGFFSTAPVSYNNSPTAFQM
jgi:hypothetical protein